MLACDMTLNFSERAFNAARVVIDRLITVEHVAKVYKVSRQAVSFAIDVVTNATNEMIQAVCCGKIPLRIAAGLLKRPESEQTDAIQNGRMKLAVERKKNPTIAERFSILFDQFKNEIKALPRGSKDLVDVCAVTSKIDAFTASCACDLTPVVPVAEQKTPVELIEQTCEQFRVSVKELKRIEGWDASSERKRAVKSFVKTIRTQVSSFEKYAGEKAGPDRTMFDADADIPEHLNTPEFQEAWYEWWNHPKTKSSRSAIVKRQQLKVLGYGDAEQAVEMLMAAIQGNWQGIQSQYWLPTSFRQDWCGRPPAHADEQLLERIDAAQSQLKTGGHAASGSKMAKLFDAVVMTVKRVWSPEARNVDDLRAAVSKLCKPEQFETLRETMSKVGINNIYRLQTGSPEWRITCDRFVDTFSSVKKAAG